MCIRDSIDRVTTLVHGEERTIARVDANLCQHCGVCVAACPSGAMSLETVNDRELVTRMGAGGWLEQTSVLQGGAGEPRILAFVCQWSIHRCV